MYTQTLQLPLGILNTGLTDLRAQFISTTGANVGAVITSGFVEVGNNGDYLWTYASFPDGHRGGIKFFSAANPTDILGVAAINPEDAELIGRYLDAAITSRAAQNSAVATVLNSVVAGTLNIIRATTFEAVISNLTLSPLWIAVDFSVKRDNNDDDDDALIHARVSNPPAGGDGLLRLNGAAALDVTFANLVVNQPAGTVAITVEDDATISLPEGGYVYDIKEFKTPSKSYQRAAGICSVTRTTTETIVA